MVHNHISFVISGPPNISTLGTNMTASKKEKRKILDITVIIARLAEIWKILFLLTKENVLFLFYLMILGSCLLHLIKQSCFLKSFLRTLILMIQVSLFLLSVLELIWNFIIWLLTSKTFKGVTDLDSSKGSGLGCFPTGVLKNCELILSCISGNLFYMCLKKSCFLVCFKVSFLV